MRKRRKEKKIESHQEKYEKDRLKAKEVKRNI